MEILLTLGVGILGGLAGKKLRLPVGAMTGSLIAVLLMKLLTNTGYLPGQTKIALQILSGAMIGSRVRLSDIKEIRNMWLAAIVLIIGMVLMNLWSATFMYRLSPLDFVTSYFASAPGGLQDMALISADYGADTVVVSLCQVCRVLYILIVFPVLYRFIYTRKLYPGPKKEVAAHGEEKVQKGAKAWPEDWIVRFLLMVAVSACGGLLFRWLGITAGALLGALIASAALNITTQKTFFPGPAKTALQIVTGAYVGMQVGKDTLIAMGGVLLPMVVMLLATTVFIYLFACVINRTMNTDFMTCLLICTPGGLQEMCLMADDMDCDAPRIVVMHTVRIIIVVSLCPIVLGLILPLLGG